MKKKFNVGRFLRALSMATLITSLLCMCVVGVFARYKSEISGTATMRVAKWDVKLENSHTELKFNDSGTKVEKEELNYEFSLVSNSEVAVGYSVKLKFNNALPANVSLTLSDRTKSQEIKCNGSQTEFTFGGFDCAIGETAELMLTVTVEYVTVENGEYRLIDFSEFTDKVKISVIAEQKMPTK